MSGYAKGLSGVALEERTDFERLRTDQVDAVRNALRTNECNAMLLWKYQNVGYLASLRERLLD